MAGQVSWHVELAVRPGRLAEFRSLTDEMVAAASAEEGTLVFERHVSNDGREVYIYERYSDSQAAEDHLEVFLTEFSARFSDLVERKRFTVFGEPSHDLRTLLAKFGATFASPMAGFFR